MGHSLTAIAGTAGRLLWSERVRQNAFHEWKRRVRGEPSLPAGPIRHILVICKGNICRSPYAAERLAKALPALQVRSGGLEAGGGDPADPGALRAAGRRGIGLDDHRTRPLTDADLTWADLILGMEGAHAAALGASWPAERGKVRLLGDFLSEAPYAIADPWGRSDEVFDHTFDRIERAVARLRQLLEARNG